MDLIRNFRYVLSKAKGPPPDAEQGMPSQQSTFTPVTPSPAQHDPEKHGPSYSQHHDPVNPADKLATFRLLAGISSHPVLDRVTSVFHNDRRLAPNLGIYTRVIRNEQNAKQSFKIASLLINGCLGLQIIVAAALTAMGAANSGHGAITAFGAINTVIAGFLTYLKGSGLPGRLKYYQTEWRRIREYIEQKERDFTNPNCPLDVYEVIDAIEVMYEETKADIEANTPEGFHPPGKQRTAAIRGPVASGTTLAPTRPASYADTLTGLQSKFGDRVHSMASGLGQRAAEMQKSAQQHTGEVGQQLHEAEHGIERARQDVEAFAKQRMSQFADYAKYKPSNASLTLSHDGTHPSITVSSGPSTEPAHPAPTHQSKPTDG